MRPPILKNWHRVTHEYRGIYVNRYGIGWQNPGGGTTPVEDGVPFEGDNYMFANNDGQPNITIRQIDNAANLYELNIDGTAGLEQLLVSTHINDPWVGVVPADGLNYEWTLDDFFCLRNVTTALHHVIYAESTGQLTIEASRASNPAAAADVTTLNMVIRYLAGPGGQPSFLFVQSDNSAIWWKPWIIDNGGGIYQLYLEQVN